MQGQRNNNDENILNGIGLERKVSSMDSLIVFHVVSVCAMKIFSPSIDWTFLGIFQQNSSIAKCYENVLASANFIESQTGL